MQNVDETHDKPVRGDVPSAWCGERCPAEVTTAPVASMSAQNVVVGHETAVIDRLPSTTERELQAPAKAYAPPAESAARQKVSVAQDTAVSPATGSSSPRTGAVGPAAYWL